MTIFDTVEAQILSGRKSANPQPIIASANDFVTMLQAIQAGLSPSGPEAANSFYAGPLSGVPANPTFRAIDTPDIAAALAPANENVVITPSGTGTVTVNPATAGTLDNISIGATTRGPAKVTTLDASGAATLNPANANVSVQPTGTGTTTIKPATAGTLDNVAIGGTTALAGKFTTITGTGLLDISAVGAGQIAFPATQDASAGANVLDDYEEGTWIPTDGSGAGLTFSAVTGCNYTKIGRAVFLTGTWTYPSTASGSNAQVNMPFANAGAAFSFGTGIYGGGLIAPAASISASTMEFFLSTGAIQTNVGFTMQTVRISAPYNAPT